MEMDRRAAILGTAMTALAIAGGDMFGINGSYATPSPKEEGLRARADRKGLLVGAAVFAKTLREDKRLAPALIADANVLTPEVELKWVALQPTPRPVTFERFEPILDFATANKMKLRGVTLTWYRDIPDWARERVKGMTAGQAGDMLERYVTTVVSHYKGRMAHWDVANEPIDWQGKLTEPVWGEKLGDRYLDIAFHAAKAADPDALLFFNTDQIEMDISQHEAHRKTTLGLLEKLVKRGVPVDAFGIEGHLDAATPFSEAKYREFLDNITGLGLKTMVTEFDMSDRAVIGSPDKRDQTLATLGQAFLDVNFSYPQCQGVVTWSLADPYSWWRQEEWAQRPDRSPLRPGLLDDKFRRKPLWAAVAAAIEAAPPR